MDCMVKGIIVLTRETFNPLFPRRIYFIFGSSDILSADSVDEFLENCVNQGVLRVGFYMKSARGPSAALRG